MTPNDISLRVSRALDGCPPTTVDLFDRLLTAPVPVTTATELGRLYGMSLKTLYSRFRRAGLPSPKRYVIVARIVRAASLARNRFLSCADIARQSGFSSPQAFSRAIRTYLGVRMTQWRASVMAEGAAEKWFIGSYLSAWHTQLRTARLVGDRRTA
jgi:AraC-like DNA-binding protein